MEQGNASKPVLRIFCDYGAEWPLWEEGLQFPEDYGLTEKLSSELAAWNDAFQEHMHWEQGWSQGFDENAWTSTGKQLARKVQQEVGDEIIVRFDA